ncbi:MAG: DUF192 domain-containing protein [Nanoarchaeota archaeon]
MLSNATRKRRLASEVTACRSIPSKALGLMFHRKLKDEAFLFLFKGKQRVSLHMLFVFFPIDVLFLDEKKRVVELKERLLPFAFYSPKKAACTVIELPAGTVSRTKTRIGDKISF